jgi:DNA-binding YbaB/EbfC family protein
MNMQAMLAQARKMQQELEKKLDEFYQKEFEIDYKNKAIVVHIYGNGQIKDIQINSTLIDPQDPITLQEMIVEAVNEATKAMKDKVDQIQSSMASGGFGGLF